MQIVAGSCKEKRRIASLGYNYMRSSSDGSADDEDAVVGESGLAQTRSN